MTIMYKYKKLFLIIATSEYGGNRCSFHFTDNVYTFATLLVHYFSNHNYRAHPYNIANNRVYFT